jgi:hypothetical protein
MLPTTYSAPSPFAGPHAALLPSNVPVRPLTHDAVPLSVDPRRVRSVAINCRPQFGVELVGPDHPLSVRRGKAYGQPHCLYVASPHSSPIRARTPALASLWLGQGRHRAGLNALTRPILYARAGAHMGHLDAPPVHRPFRCAQSACSLVVCRRHVPVGSSLGPIPRPPAFRPVDNRRRPRKPPSRLPEFFRHRRGSPEQAELGHHFLP